MHNYVLKSGVEIFMARCTVFPQYGWMPAVSFLHSFRWTTEFGANIGGPIKKDKIFFFTNFSGYYYTATARSFCRFPPWPNGPVTQRPAGHHLRPRGYVRRRDGSKQPFPQPDSGQQISGVAKSFSPTW
jgi:hypothetical protein